MNNAQLINNIKLICKQKSIPLGTMLESCNLSKGFIYDVEKRDRTPSIDKISAISEYLGVSVDYLLGRTNTPSSVQPLNSQDQITTEMLKAFEKLSFKDKIAVLNYTLNIENPPQRIVQTQTQKPVEKKPVPYVASDPSGKNTKGFIDISDEALVKGETDDYSKYD